jgi:cytochrome c oxidase subunit 2
MISSQHTKTAATRQAHRGTWSRLLAVMLFLLATAGSTWAQADPVKGQQIFMSNCARCHNPKLEKDMTGPGLYKVQERIPGGDWIYRWIRNNNELRASGDKYANEVYAKYNKAQMDPFPNLTNEDIDHIMAWVAKYEPVAAAAGPTDPGGKDFSQDETLSSLRGWVIFLLLVVVILLGNIAMLVAKSRGIELFAGVNFDRVNAWLFLLFYILMAGGFAWSANLFSEYFLFDNAASEHGEKIDMLFWITMAVVVAVFLFTNLLLFFFAFRYFRRDGRKAHYYPENHKLELIWTVVPAIVLASLVMYGIKTWNETMGDPELVEGQTELVEIELNAQQFTWNIRYPGADNKFGTIDRHLIGDDNQLGVDFSEPESHDDFMAQELWLPKGKRVNLRIRSRDVLHSAYLPHFRVKMDAVPGMPTRFHFVPTKTTKEMQEILGDTTFYYELACAEVCGKGHFSMQRKVVVVEEEDFNKWLKEEGAKSKLYDPAKHASFSNHPSTELRASNKPVQQ